MARERVPAAGVDRDDDPLPSMEARVGRSAERNFDPLSDWLRPS
jgi:hypothetical protein